MIGLMRTMRERTIKAKPIFAAVSPGPHQIFAGKIARIAYRISRVYKYSKMAKKHFVDGVPYSHFAGNFAASRVMWVGLGPTKKKIKALHVHTSRTSHDWSRKNGIGGRSWINTPGVYKMTMIFHDANKAGPHVDVHIGRFSLIYKVTPDIYQKIKYNSGGQLTENSKKLLVDMVKEKVGANANVPQNLDHTVSNAHASWTFGDRSATHYGAGYTRQIISQSEVEVYKTGYGHPIEMYAPAINPYRMQYIYKIYDGKSSGVPICTWGTKSANHPVLEDRLHLKMLQPEKTDNLSLEELETSTAKYDGSSCYVVITPKGTTIWSPRKSVVTGDRIEYTGKLPDLARTTSDRTTVVMGELLFREKPRLRKEGGAYISAARTSGVLNASKPTPKGLTPEVRLYRVDLHEGKKTTSLPFWENRELQHKVAKLNPKSLKVVQTMTPQRALELGYEGVVVVNPDSSINNGTKVKWWEDPNDWRIDDIQFTRGPRGAVAGVVHATSLDSGKKFKLGPGQVGNERLTVHMMNNPEHYLGAVVKVNSRKGHEGRAAKVLSFHDDKGLAPVTS